MFIILPTDFDKKVAIETQNISFIDYNPATLRGIITMKDGMLISLTNLANFPALIEKINECNKVKGR